MIWCCYSSLIRLWLDRYNGTPRGLTNCNEGGCARCNGCAGSGQALDECLCLHAEENALLEAGRQRIGDDGAVIYCNTWVSRFSITYFIMFWGDRMRLHVDEELSFPRNEWQRGGPHGCARRIPFLKLLAYRWPDRHRYWAICFHFLSGYARFAS